MFLNTSVIILLLLQQRLGVICLNYILFKSDYKTYLIDLNDHHKK